MLMRYCTAAPSLLRMDCRSAPSFLSHSAASYVSVAAATDTVS